MKKRYQVFVSSTFLDLQDERREVMQALLELRCIPSGMELFPASNDEQWKLIRRVIDDSDYYLVVVGGRYGSIGPSGLSYTEMEYRYAVEKGKPVIGFIHENPGSIAADRCESTPEGKQKLAEFVKLVEQKMVKHWKNAHDLGSKVSRSIVNLMEDYPAVGWVRSDLVPDEDASTEMLKLKKRIEELENQLESARHRGPKGSEHLSQGGDLFKIAYTFKVRPKDSLEKTNWSGTFMASWNDIFAWTAPHMLDEASDRDLKRALDAFAESVRKPRLPKDKRQLKNSYLSEFVVAENDFHTIKIQFLALGLMAKSIKKKSLKATGNFWSLTPYGESVLTNLRAIRKEANKAPEPTPGSVTPPATSR